MRIDKNSRIPLYAQLMDIIKHKISAREWKENDQLPSEREWCETYDVSRTTVRQAIIELESEGHIFTQHGKGSFVAKKTFTQKLNKFYSFSEEMSRLGKIQTNRVTSFQILPSNGKIAHQLQIKERSKVYEMKRLRLVDNDPVLMETTYLPEKLFPKLSKTDLEQRALYDILRTNYQISIQKAQERFRAAALPEEEARFLQVDAGNPGMKIERIAFCDSQVIEYTIAFAHGEKYSFSTELE